MLNCFILESLSKEVASKACMFVFCHLQVPVIVVTNLSVDGWEPVSFPPPSSSAVEGTTPRACVFFFTVCVPFSIICWMRYSLQHAEVHIV